LKKGRRQKKIWADSGYQSKELKSWFASKGCELDVVKRPPKWKRDPTKSKDLRAKFVAMFQLQQPKPGFEIQPRRWVVERTFAWFGRFRRLSKDYEYTIPSAKSYLHLAMIRITLKRLSYALKPI
jgi:putative transposase